MSEFIPVPRAMAFDTRGRPTPKRAAVAVFLLGGSGLTMAQIAKAVGVSERYVYGVKQSLLQGSVQGSVHPPTTQNPNAGAGKLTPPESTVQGSVQGLVQVPAESSGQSSGRPDTRDAEKPSGGAGKLATPTRDGDASVQGSVQDEADSSPPTPPPSVCVSNKPTEDSEGDMDSLSHNRGSSREEVLFPELGSEVGNNGKCNTKRGAGKNKRKEMEETAREIYALYPRKIDPREAVSAIIKAIKDGADPEMLKRKTEAYARAVGPYLKTHRRLIPHPSKWFRRGRWELDEEEWTAAFTDPRDSRRSAEDEAVRAMWGEPTDYRRSDGGDGA